MTTLEWARLAVTLALSVTAMWIATRTPRRSEAAAARARRNARHAWGQTALMELLGLKAERVVQTIGDDRRA